MVLTSKQHVKHPLANRNIHQSTSGPRMSGWEPLVFQIPKKFDNLRTIDIKKQ